MAIGALLLLIGTVPPALAAGDDPVAVAGYPRAEVPEEVVDLGQVVRGEVREATFAVRNAGKAALHILHVAPG